MLEEHERLVIDNLGLATYIALGYNINHSDLDDLISIGRVGLIKAAKGFDGNKKIKFCTYAGTCVNNEIRMHLRRNRKHMKCLSLDAPACRDGEGHEMRIADRLTDDRQVDDGIMKEFERQQVREMVESTLNDKERKVIYMRYGLDGEGPLLQHEIARRLGHSQSVISRIEKRSLEKLRQRIMKEWG